MKDKMNKGNQLIIFVLIINVAVQIANTLRVVLTRGLEFRDYIWVWRESVCTFYGIDIMDAIQNQSVINGIHMPPASATMPYARILANVIHPGFLEERSAVVYGIILYIAVTVCAVLVLYKTVKKECSLPSGMLMIYVVLLAFSSWWWVDSIISWNNGVLFSMFLIIAVCIVDDCEIGAGILLALAMIKPQIAGIFYISFFIKKKYKTILTSCIILLISWLAYLVVVGGNPITQMLEILGQAQTKSAGYLWFGIFDVLVRAEVPGVVVIVSSMIVGILATAALSIWVIRNRSMDCNIIYYSIPALMSTVWCYKSVTDLVILLLPSLIFIFIIDWRGGGNISLPELAFVTAYILILNIKTFCGIVRRVVGYEWILGVSFDAYARVAVFIIMLLLLKHLSRSRNELTEMGMR